jgi:hypothetical protein
MIKEIIKKEKKQWWKSKTIIIAILQAIAGITTIIINENPTLEIIGYIATGKSLIDMIIRSLTYEKIK